MRQLSLTEYQTTAAEISEDEIRALRKITDSVAVSPTTDRPGFYDLTPGSSVGAVHLGELAVEIRPKIPIDRLLFLISYTLNPDNWRETDFDFTERRSLLEAIIPGFVSQVRRALHRGLLQGYRSREDSLATVRGRIRFDDQLRDRFGIFPPVEVRYDEFTEDITENRLLKAALQRLSHLHIRSDRARQSLRAFDAALVNVSTVAYHPSQLPDIHWTRLNDRYRPAVELAKLILRSTSFDLSHGGIRSASFLVDMNRVFEDFVAIALRESLRLSEAVFPQGMAGRRLRLDRAERITLLPDISWWDGRRCMFVGDVKYKRVDHRGIRHADLYQLLAYTIATDLPGGLLIYAAGEADEAVHEIVHAGKRLEVVPLDLAGTPDQILAQIDAVAGRVRRLRRLAKGAARTEPAA